MTTFIACMMLSLLQANSPATRPAEAPSAAVPTTQPRSRVMAKAAYERTLAAAEGAYRREVRETETRLVAELDAALKLAMQNGNLTEANRINDERQQAVKRLQSVASRSPEPATAAASVPVAPQPPAAPQLSIEARAAAREALKTKLTDTQWSWPDRSFGNRAHYTLKADGTITAGWHNRTGWWIVAGDNTIVAQIGATSGPVLVLFDDQIRKGHLKDEGGQITERQE